MCGRGWGGWGGGEIVIIPKKKKMKILSIFSHLSDLNPVFNSAPIFSVALLN